jgi:hypothetical protein
MSGLNGDKARVNRLRTDRLARKERQGALRRKLLQGGVVPAPVGHARKPAVKAQGAPHAVQNQAHKPAA